MGNDHAMIRDLQRGIVLGSNNLRQITTPKDFFTEIIEEVEKEVSYVEFHPLSKSYLSEMLVTFLPTDNLFFKDENGNPSQSKMLAELWLETQNEEPNSRIIKLKRLAETSLYVSGFFASSLKRRLVSQSYYIQIGEMAYSALAKSNSTKDFSDIYGHFSKCFSGYVEVLTEVSHKVHIQKSGDLLEAFDRYIDSGSEWAKKQLIEEGVFSYHLKKTSN